MRAFAKIGASLALILGLATAQAQEMPGPGDAQPAGTSSAGASRRVTLGRPEPMMAMPTAAALTTATPMTATANGQADDMPVLKAMILVNPQRAQPVVRGQSPAAPPPPPPVSPFGAPAVGGPAAGYADKDEAYRCGVVNDNSDLGGFWSRMHGKVRRCYDDLTGSMLTGAACPPGPHCWASAEFLLFWVKNGPLNVPLVTTNPDAFGSIGALNEPGTRVLFGGPAGNIDYGTRFGGRLTAGGWLDAEKRVGAEVSGFILSGDSRNFSASSAGGSAPIVSIPFNAIVAFNGNPPGETSLNAGNVPNTVSVHSTNYLWGVEGNGLFKLLEDQRSYLRFLVGPRFLRLSENLTLTDTFTDSTRKGIISVADGFHTRNEFYGAQIGLRGGISFGKLNAEATIKAAFGVDYEFSNVSGSTTVTNGAFGFPTGTTAGGVFAQPSNIGSSNRTAFTIVPEAEIKIGYDVTNNVRVFVGYDFLYVSDVLRPGNQINRNINPTQSALFGGTGGTLVGPAQPTPQTHRSDFWAHGVVFGVQVRY